MADFKLWTFEQVAHKNVSHSLVEASSSIPISKVWNSSKCQKASLRPQTSLSHKASYQWAPPMVKQRLAGLWAVSQEACLFSLEFISIWLRKHFNISSQACPDTLWKTSRNILEHPISEKKCVLQPLFKNEIHFYKIIRKERRQRMMSHVLYWRQARLHQPRKQ